MIRDDAVTMAAIRGGDLDAFSSIVEKYQTQLVRYLYHLVGNEQAALDLTQDTFLEAYRAIGSLRSDLALRAWLFRIATNRAIELHRRRRLIQWLPLLGAQSSHHGATPSSEDTYSQRDLVLQALHSLPPEQAVCLLLHHQEGFTYAEVAAIVGTSAEAMRKRIARARDQFRTVYQDIAGEETS